MKKTKLLFSWELVENKTKLEREFIFKNFTQAIEFVNNVAKLAEEQNHHPNIYIFDYKKVKITLHTHSEEKVTSKDYLLAEEINKIY